MPPGITFGDFYNILPELVLTAGLLVVLIADVLLPRRSGGWLAWPRCWRTIMAQACSTPRMD